MQYDSQKYNKSGQFYEISDRVFFHVSSTPDTRRLLLLQHFLFFGGGEERKSPEVTHVIHAHTDGSAPFVRQALEFSLDV